RRSPSPHGVPWRAWGPSKFGRCEKARRRSVCTRSSAQDTKRDTPHTRGPGAAAWPAATLVTVTFAGHAGTTRLTLQQSVLVRRPSTYAPSVVEVAHVMTQAA